MVIADWTAHATDPRLLPSRHWQVVELEAILVEIQADLAVHKDSAEKKHPEHQRK